ncbi:MAG TPA: glycoside hydrolase family 16 protein [Deltaproteobacteria bacterium]|nr:glycoside hydrolase family 16 protein [Deltaproteobacteria bacterium]
MSKKLSSRLLSLMFAFVFVPSSLYGAAALLFDDFVGTIVSSTNWHIPTWVSSTDGTYVGRTQFKCTQNAPLPPTQSGNAVIDLETYNPTALPCCPSFYGTDLISNQLFYLDQGVDIKVRAKMNTTQTGLVGGIFLYALVPGSTTNRDEIDFELLTNLPNQVLTNIYSDESQGAGNPGYVLINAISIQDYHTYEIQWLGNQVSWLIDGVLVRTAATNVPAGPMYLHLNMWAPDSSFTDAYDGSLQPTTSPSLDQTFSMLVDSVTVTSTSSGTLLWHGTGGSVSIWTLDPSVSYLGSVAYGPYLGWTPGSYVPPDGPPRLLWTTASGQISIWRFDSSDNYTGSVVYGPYSGWAPGSYFANPDGTGRLVWTTSSGEISIWRLDSMDNYTGCAVYGPYAGWTSGNYSRNPDGTARIYWTTSSGEISIWRLDSMDNYTGCAVYGPYAGWAPGNYSRNPDGTARIYWTTVSGEISIWRLDSMDNYTGCAVYGPYAGWKPIDLK